MNSMKFALPIYLISTAILLAGCGGGPRKYPVKGTVKYKDGTPMAAGGIIIFSSADPGVKVTAQGEILADGTFKVGTTAADDGAPAGRYLLSITLPPLPNPNRPPPGWPPIHDKYSSKEKSGLEYTVTENGKNEVTIEVER